MTPTPSQAPDEAGVVERRILADQFEEPYADLIATGHPEAPETIPVSAALRAIGAALSPPPVVEEADPEADLVARFSAALLTKLRASEEKYGWQRAWMRPVWSVELPPLLLKHVNKGDPVDVAVYAAFAWHHGWSVAPTPTAGDARKAETTLASWDIAALCDEVRRLERDRSAAPRGSKAHQDVTDKLASVAAPVLAHIIEAQALKLAASHVR